MINVRLNQATTIVLKRFRPVLWFEGSHQSKLAGSTEAANSRNFRLFESQLTYADDKN